MDIGLAVGALMWSPAFAALITCALFKIKISTLGWNFYPIRYECIAYLLPLLYSLPVYLAVWLTISDVFELNAFMKTQSITYGIPNAPHFATWFVAIPLIMTIGVIRSLALTLGEEIGWRGFLFPRLNTRFGFTKACFLSGIIWAMWHYLGILYLGYGGATPKVEAFICFTITVIALSFILGYIRLKTNSIWPCAILHASHNIIIQAIFNPMTSQTGKATLIVGEFGIGLVLTTSVLAIWFWHKETVDKN
ncbi:MAG: CPBP family intramembrane metalloprotease [Legionella sp.]|nr:CPBP family intramembrane metalloprotease [Legionella sp.]